ncbi:MAG TPA: DUF2723 domain-containing protein [Vicinamibacterales bacterium]
MSSTRLRLLAAASLAAVAFLLYVTTLLPGQDLGDTASFQTVTGRTVLTPREGYPLYYAVTNVFLHLLPGEPARACNLASAVEAALAVGLLVLVGAEVGGTVVAGLVAGLFLAGSYTFWSQAIIAEVYSLHLFLVGACVLALLAWHRRPTLSRLSLFFGIFAIGFGNHLSMVLLLPGFALFLLVAAPDGLRSMLRPRVVLLAVGIASLGALQYYWNFSALIAEPDHAGLVEMLKSFWFDVTKTDWRAVMVVGVPNSTIGDRFAMYWFDVGQQFGVAGVMAALIGLWAAWVRRWQIGLLLAVLWIVNWGFAFTYNVGDTHVFYLPSHWAIALAAGCGAGWLVERVDLAGAPPRGAGPRRAWQVPARVGAALVLLAYPAWRAYDTYPAMDRSRDWGPKQFYDGLVAGLDSNREILGADMNWQLHNGLDYYSKCTRPDLVMFDVPEIMLTFPFLVWHNQEMGRSVALTEGSAAMLRAAYGDLLPIERDPRAAQPTLAEKIAALPRGTSYVLGLIEGDPDTPVDQAELANAARALGLRPNDLPRARFAVLAGRIGEPPVAREAGERPFRLRTAMAGHRLDVRMECWLPADTIRRMGFGHVIVDRRHALTLDRGVSFVALNEDGTPRATGWLGGLFTPQTRFIIRPGK